MRHLVAVLVLVLLAPAAARAETLPSRVWGLGGGFAIGSERTSVDTSHTFVQPLNLEVRAAVSPHLELALHLPVTSMLYGNYLEGGNRRFVWFDLFAVWYPLRESSGLFVAPGLGMIYGSTSGSSGLALEVPARLGWELSRGSHGFGRAVAVRPWFDVVFPSGEVDTGTRYGFLVELTLIGYATR
jgi:hypothetical protein